jgi:ApaG protein
MYRAVTRQIEVTVEPAFMPERSVPDRGQFFWSYTIAITNNGGETVQLRTRHWIITDATGHIQEVKGPGVVGEQPTLGPGESFQYTSGCPLPTSTGVMRGTYQMVTEDGDHFDVEIAPFALHEPYTVH